MHWSLFDGDLAVAVTMLHVVEAKALDVLASLRDDWEHRRRSIADEMA